jgi:hypothetical protein
MLGFFKTASLILAGSSALVAADGLNARAQKIGKVRILVYLLTTSSEVVELAHSYRMSTLLTPF